MSFLFLEFSSSLTLSLTSPPSLYFTTRYPPLPLAPPCVTPVDLTSPFLDPGRGRSARSFFVLFVSLNPPFILYFLIFPFSPFSSNFFYISALILHFFSYSTFFYPFYIFFSLLFFIFTSLILPFLSSLFCLLFSFYLLRVLLSLIIP